MRKQGMTKQFTNGRIRWSNTIELETLIGICRRADVRI